LLIVVAIEAIINEWGMLIETSAREFHKQAQQVSEWDKKILENQDKARHLHLPRGLVDL